MKSLTELRKIIEPAILAMGYELVNLELHRQHKKMILQIFVDGPNGITLDACARVSRQISSVLDVEDPFSGAYDLEVSSPGLDRPLFTLADFQRFLGKKIALRLRTAKDNQRNFKGVIKEILGNEILITLDNNELLKIDLNEVEKAKLEPTF